MVTAKSPNRGYSSTPLGLSLLVVFLAGVFACPIVLAQPAPAKPADPSDAKKAAETTPEPAKATPVTPPTEPKYDEDPVNESRAFKQTVGAKALSLLAPAGKFGAGDQAAFDQFYNEYQLSRWSQVKNITKLPDFRKSLRNDLQKAKSGEVHDHLNTLALEYLKKLATGNYHPVVQVNAVLMIGDLNKEELGVGTPPKPLPAAFDVLLADVQNAKLTEAVRAAAMVGIQRHVVLGISDEETKRPLTAAMLKLVAAADPSDGAPTTPGRDWICAQAVETLGYLGAVGQNNAVFNAMFKTLADNKLSISTRSIAARSLGRLNYSGVTGINSVEVAAALGQFLVDACNDVSQLAKTTSKPALLRNWIRQPLRDASAALIGPEDAAGKGGVKPLAPEGSLRTYLDKLQEKIETLAGFLDDPKHEKDDLLPQVDGLRKALEAWLKEKPAPK
jgi:hypothetical protein